MTSGPAQLRQAILDTNLTPMTKLIGLVVITLTERQAVPERLSMGRIARSAGVSRTTVTRHLHRLREAGLDPAALLDPADPKADQHRAELAEALDGFHGPRARPAQRTGHR